MKPIDRGRLRTRSQTARHTPTHAERRLWLHLRRRQIAHLRFRRQRVIAGYITDFCCHEARLIIELDGPIHDQEPQRAYDTRRQSDLEAAGYRVLRFTNAQILYDLPRALYVIHAAVTESLL